LIRPPTAIVRLEQTTNIRFDAPPFGNATGKVSVPLVRSVTFVELRTVVQFENTSVALLMTKELRLEEETSSVTLADALLVM